MAIEIKQKIKPFPVPSFVIVETPPRPRREGFNFTENKIPISELSLDVLDQLCEQFKIDIFKLKNSTQK